MQINLSKEVLTYLLYLEQNTKDFTKQENLDFFVILITNITGQIEEKNLKNKMLKYYQSELANINQVNNIHFNTYNIIDNTMNIIGIEHRTEFINICSERTNISKKIIQSIYYPIKDFEVSKNLN